MTKATLPDLFTCPRHSGGLRLTTTACSSMWRKGQTADRFSTLHVCCGCPVGALHAGETQPQAQPQPSPTLCVRCGETGRRLVRGQICVSCYNRERERRVGRDRRGKFPATAPVVIPMSALMSMASINATQIGCHVSVAAASRVELVLLASRRSSGALVGRWACHGSPIQVGLFPGV